MLGLQPWFGAGSIVNNLLSNRQFYESDRTERVSVESEISIDVNVESHDIIVANTGDKLHV